MAIHQLWGLVQAPVSTSRAGRVGTQGTKQNLCFRVAPTASELWDAVVAEEFFGTAHTKPSLQKLGWRAVPVMVVVGD